MSSWSVVEVVGKKRTDFVFPCTGILKAKVNQALTETTGKQQITENTGAVLAGITTAAKGEF